MNPTEFAVCRVRRGWTQGLVADAVDTPRGSFSMLVRGKRPMPVALAQRIADVLEVPLAAITVAQVAP